MKNLTIITLAKPNISDFAAARNEELQRAPEGWILFLDTDEKVAPKLEAEIDEAISSDRFGAYYLPREDTFLSRKLKYGENGKSLFLRLAKKGYGQWVGPVHETWRGKGPVGYLSNPIHHTPHPTISAFLAKIDRYSEIESHYRFGQGRRSALWQIAIYPVAKFIKNYLWLQGFRDGTPGIIMALMMSLHSFLTWTKLYLLQQRA